MSRKGDGTASNYLSPLTSVFEDHSDVTIGIWYNLDDNTTNKTLLKIENGGADMDIVSFNDSVQARMGSNVSLSQLPIIGNWHLLMGRSNAGGNRVWLSGKGDAFNAGTGNTLASANFSRLDIGSRNGSSDGVAGFYEHAFMFLRSLSDGEFNALFGGVNPFDIDSMGRFCYYPLTTPSLANVWQPIQGTAGIATLNGTLPFTDVHAPVRPPKELDIPAYYQKATAAGKPLTIEDPEGNRPWG